MLIELTLPGKAKLSMASCEDYINLQPLLSQVPHLGDPVQFYDLTLLFLSVWRRRIIMIASFHLLSSRKTSATTIFSFPTSMLLNAAISTNPAAAVTYERLKGALH